MNPCMPQNVWKDVVNVSNDSWYLPRDLNLGTPKNQIKKKKKMYSTEINTVN